MENTVALIIDLVFFAVFLGIIILNTARGFVKAFMQLGSNIVSLIVAGLFSKKLGAFFDERFVSDWLNEKLSGLIMDQLPDLSTIPSGIEVTINDLLETITSKFSMILSVAGVNIAELSGEYGSLPATEENVLLMSRHVGGNLSVMISNAIAFVLIFVVCLLLFAILTSILNSVTKLPVIKTANRVLGLVFGVLVALIIGSLASLAVTKLIEIIAVFIDGVDLMGILEGSYVLRFFGEHNLVSMLIEAIMK